jgi:hypothetical protein
MVNHSYPLQIIPNWYHYYQSKSSNFFSLSFGFVSHNKINDFQNPVIESIHSDSEEDETGQLLKKSVEEPDVVTRPQALSFIQALLLPGVILVSFESHLSCYGRQIQKKERKSLKILIDNNGTRIACGGHVC